MPTSGTTSFDLDLSTLIEEAYERAGRELKSGYQYDTARRSLNLLLIEWINKGLQLWTIEQGQIPLTLGRVTYDLPVDTVDLLDTVIRQGTGQQQIDITITRVSESVYSTIPNKNTVGRPIQVWVDKQSGAVNPDGTRRNPRVWIWPTADKDNYYTFVYWRMRRIQDAGKNFDTTQDLPFRYLPALAAGLAYYLALKDPQAMDRLQVLKAVYDEQFDLAFTEDRDKSSWSITPWSNPALY